VSYKDHHWHDLYDATVGPRSVAKTQNQTAILRRETVPVLFVLASTDTVHVPQDWALFSTHVV